MPVEAEHIWQWYWDLRGTVRQSRDGGAEPIPPSEFLAWAKATETVVRSVEYAILRDMDMAFCEALNVEIEDEIERNKPEPPKKGAKR